MGLVDGNERRSAREWSATTTTAIATREKRQGGHERKPMLVLTRSIYAGLLETQVQLLRQYADRRAVVDVSSAALLH